MKMYVPHENFVFTFLGQLNLLVGISPGFGPGDLVF